MMDHECPDCGERIFALARACPHCGAASQERTTGMMVAGALALLLVAIVVAIVVVLRHFSTPIGYTDAIWAKYGAAFSELANVKDPKTKQAPNKNMFNVADYGTTLPNFGVTLDSGRFSAESKRVAAEVTGAGPAPRDPGKEIRPTRKRGKTKR